MAGERRDRQAANENLIQMQQSKVMNSPMFPNLNLRSNRLIVCSSLLLQYNGS